MKQKKITGKNGAGGSATGPGLSCLTGAARALIGADEARVILIGGFDAAADELVVASDGPRDGGAGWSVVSILF